MNVAMWQAAYPLSIKFGLYMINERSCCTVADAYGTGKRRGSVARTDVREVLPRGMERSCCVARWKAGTLRIGAKSTALYSIDRRKLVTF